MKKLKIEGFLKEIIQLKKNDIKEALKTNPLKQIRDKAEKRKIDADFKSALASSDFEHPGIIAEIKKASPSRGVISRDLNPAIYAEKYTKAGATAISVLTEKHYFKGCISDIVTVRENSTLPILRKDFTIDAYQIYEARAFGADAILLITSILERDQLKDFINLAREVSLEPLVEIHNEDELEKADYCGAEIIGVNNRNLSTLKTDCNVSKRIAPLFNENHIPVEASGIKDRKDITQGIKSGFYNFLVGESIVRADDTVQFIKQLIGSE